MKSSQYTLVARVCLSLKNKIVTIRLKIGDISIQFLLSILNLLDR